MSKYINADEIDYKIICYPHYDFYTKIVYTKELDGMYALKTDIDAIPAADVQEVKHGRWISNELSGYKWAYYCSECAWIDGYPFNDRHKYCPNCGAKMDNDDFCSKGERRKEDVDA